MKHWTIKRRWMLAFMLGVISLSGCGSNDVQDSSWDEVEQAETATIPSSFDGDLSVRFGDDGQAFALHMEDNPTANAIVGYVGTSQWRLPVYDWDDDIDYSVMEYYDIPDRYDIPASPERVHEVKAGEVYYSDPNRIVLFYQDATVDEEYVKIGSFDATTEFVQAVENNPVLEGWDNKIIQIALP